MKKLITRAYGIINSYRRPHSKFQCGRSQDECGSCFLGPTPAGKCQGTSACRPSKVGDRWICQRPRSEGGVCQKGPTPLGECCLTRPACSPKPVLRTFRGRISLIIFILLLATLLLAANNLQGVLGKVALDAGPLSPSHAQFTSKNGCTNCHEQHNEGLLSSFKLLGQELSLSKNCTSCHGFEGVATAPHTMSHNRFDSTLNAQVVQCTQCHSTHTGLADLKETFNDMTCISCHEEFSKQFASGHPEFGADTLKVSLRPSIIFNHNSHFGKHFEDPKFKGDAPKSCLGCHDYSRAEKSFPVKGYDESCASCHDGQISKRPMTLLNFPTIESEPGLFKMSELQEYCAPQRGSEAELYLREAKALVIPLMTIANDKNKNLIDLANKISNSNHITDSLHQSFILVLENNREVFSNEPDLLESLEELVEGFAYILEYESVSDQELSVLFGQLINKPVDDPEEYSDSVIKFFRSIIENDDLSALYELIEEKGLLPEMGLRGLSPVLIKDAACAWLQNEEYLQPFDPELAGWSADALGIHYTAGEHGDSVMRSWVDLASRTISKDPVNKEALFDKFLKQDGGVGNCVKCHAVNKSSANINVEWNYSALESDPLVKFDHKLHVNFFEEDVQCQSCHEKKPSDEFLNNYLSLNPASYQSNFNKVNKDSCLSCHGEGEISQSCRTCHDYHVGSFIKAGLTGEFAHTKSAKEIAGELKSEK